MIEVAALLSRATQNVQAIYLAGFCVWLLSFNRDNDALLHTFLIVPKLCTIIRTISREKVSHHMD